VLDSVSVAAELANFEFEFYRTASVSVLDRFFLCYVKFNQAIFYVDYQFPFFLTVIVVLRHCQSPSQHFWQSSVLFFEELRVNEMIHDVAGLFAAAR
jgi:hypothetical protein